VPFLPSAPPTYSIIPSECFCANNPYPVDPVRVPPELSYPSNTHPSLGLSTSLKFWVCNFKILMVRFFFFTIYKN
jgi:hypothetical protein